MTKKLAQALAALQNLSPERQDELAEILTDVALPTIQFADNDEVPIIRGLAAWRSIQI